MGSPLGCLLGFILALFVFVGVFLLSIIGKIRAMWTMLNSNSRKKQNNNRSYQNQSRQNTNVGGTSTKSSSHQKVFADDEGEYVDYEEIK